MYEHVVALNKEALQKYKESFLFQNQCDAIQHIQHEVSVLSITFILTECQSHLYM